MQIFYDKSVSEVFRKPIEERLETISGLFPDWCSTLIVFYSETTEDGNSLACSSNYPYRFIQLTVFSGFLDDPMWEEGLIHEIQHGIQSPYIDKVEYIINTYIVNEELRSYIIDDLRNLEEGVCQDFTSLLMKWKDKYGS